MSIFLELEFDANADKSVEAKLNYLMKTTPDAVSR